MTESKTKAEKVSTKKPTVRVSFHGAAGSVTGSRHLIEADKYKILVDCGLFQGKKSLRKRNWEDPHFKPSKINCIILSHAHIDHSGYLPLVVKRGFNGPIYCTAATKELLHLLLPDAAYIQEEEARFANKHKSTKHSPAKPLFNSKDAKDTLKLLKVFDRNAVTEILPKVFLSAKCAGHILGSVALNLEISGKLITFSGDIGRYDTPMLPDPQGIDLGDLLLCESTYGNRLHAEVDAKGELEKAINKASARGGALLIPAFAVGRTQNLLYYIAELERAGKIPVLPVYVDSPMAVDATKIYRKFNFDYDAEAKQIMAQGDTPLSTAKTVLCRSSEESKRLNNAKGARIIISASGMVTGGRIMHHMMHQLPKEDTTVLFVGYQAVGTRGRIIQSGVNEIKIFGQRIPIRAKIRSISGLSAHGDKGELSKWLKSGNGSPSLCRIVHGERESAGYFSNLLQYEFGWKSAPAKYLETIEI